MYMFTDACIYAIKLYYPQFTAEECTPRTKAMHERLCGSLGGPAHKEVATTYGVNRNSILNDLSYFHVTSGLPPDLMHDIFEGVAVIEIKCMLSVFVQVKNYFSLTTVNNRIQSFPYGYPDSTNKPLPLPLKIFSNTTEALKQSCMYINLSSSPCMFTVFFSATASQTWCLIRLLPLIIGDLIPIDSDPYWKNYLLLVSIVDYVCAPESTLGIAGHLRSMIAEHHSNFKQLYPHRPLTPKFHYMTHMPQWIVQ